LLLEKPLFDFCLGLLIAGLLSLLAISPTRINSPTMSLRSVAAAMRNRMRERRARGISALEEQWAENEFAFEHAIEAYEELIDATTERRT
jgi:uncharacterized membrane protein YgaE (UPF0421/DUF939 family)